VLDFSTTNVSFSRFATVDLDYSSTKLFEFLIFGPSTIYLVGLEKGTKIKHLGNLTFKYCT
jgi:hypothetical protein